MEKLEHLSEKINRYVSLSIFGLLSVLFGIIGDTISFLMFPGYNITRNPVSELCEGSGGLFFQLGTTLSGIFAFFFLIYLGNIFNTKEVGDRTQKLALRSAIISCTFFIILGIFCGSNIIIAYIHGTSAVLSWIFGFSYITLYNILIIRDSRFSKYLGYFGFITSFIIALLITLFLLHLIPLFRVILIILPTLEWINTLAVIVWYLAIPIYMIKKKM
ncbi:MAG: hypothetical protein ACFFE4_20140 [Candidatus Thorarchaeota archaeon]